MSWLFKALNFFKKGSTEANDQIENVQLTDLDAWLKLQTQQLLTTSGLNGELVNYVNVLKDKRWMLERQLDEWESKLKPFGADWIDYDLEEIKNLFQETRTALGVLTFPENITVETVLGLNLSLEPKIKYLLQKADGTDFVTSFNLIFNDDSVKDPIKADTNQSEAANDSANNSNNQITNHLLTELLELENIKRDFEQKLTSCGYSAIKFLTQKTVLLNSHVSQLEMLEKELLSKRERQNIADSKKKEKEIQIAELKQEPGYVSLSSLKQKRAEILKKIEGNKDSIFIFFSKIRPLLIRYKDFEKELISAGINPGSNLPGSNLNNSFNNGQLIDTYLKDSVAAFINDQNLSIKPILKQLKAVLNEERFSLSSKETNFLLEFLDKVEGTYLNQLQQNQSRLTEELHSLGWIPANNDFISKVEDLEYRLEHFSRQIEALSGEILLLEDKKIKLIEQLAGEQNLFQNMVDAELHKKVIIGF
ncbi:MAG: hypothetical protein AABW48_03320 [Nanoarchaeota archaeon]